MTSTTQVQPTTSALQRPVVVLLALITFSLLWCDATFAVTFGFDNITGNSAASAATGESQLSVDVFNGSGTVKFRFMNSGPDDSIISEIYFDDGSLLGISTIIDDPPNVDFELGANPGDLPGGDLISPAFEVTEFFLAQADNPAPVKGVGPGQEVTIMFDLIGGQTLQDVLDELDDGTLRIGIHVIAFANGQSESFVNNIPEPTTVALLCLGLAITTCSRRRR